MDRVPDGKMDSLHLKGKGRLKVGETDQTVTEAVYQDGTRIPLLEGVIYDSSSKDVASVDERGLVTALAEGTTVISATYEAFQAEYVLNVQAPGNPGGDNGNGGGNPGGTNGNEGSGHNGGSGKPAPVTPRNMKERGAYRKASCPRLPKATFPSKRINRSRNWLCLAVPLRFCKTSR